MEEIIQEIIYCIQDKIPLSEEPLPETILKRNIWNFRYYHPNSQHLTEFNKSKKSLEN